MQYGAATSAPSSSYNVMYQQQEDTVSIYRFFFACRFFFVNFSKRFQGIDAFAQFGQQSQQYHPSPELSEQINASKCSPYLTEVKMRSFQLKIGKSSENYYFLDRKPGKIGLKLNIFGACNTIFGEKIENNRIFN